MMRSMTAHAEHEHATAAEEIFRKGGRRLTAQRVAIWNLLIAEPDAHLSAEPIAERVRARMPRVHPSTVYRTLELLVEDGLVLQTDLGGDRSFYEPAHEHRHHHLVCESCGRVEHVHDDVLDEVAARLRRDWSFELAGRELTLFGRCRDCRDRT
jgi:Fur family ferric uptake transcriptional regulator